MSSHRRRTFVRPLKLYLIYAAAVVVGVPLIAMGLAALAMLI